MAGFYGGVQKCSPASSNWMRLVNIFKAVKYFLNSWAVLVLTEVAFNINKTWPFTLWKSCLDTNWMIAGFKPEKEHWCIHQCFKTWNWFNPCFFSSCIYTYLMRATRWLLFSQLLNPCCWNSCALCCITALSCSAIPGSQPFCAL